MNSLGLKPKNRHQRAKAKISKLIKANVANVAKMDAVQRIVMTSELRRERVFELRIKGLTCNRIAQVLGVDPRTVDRDIAAIKTGVVASVQRKIDNFDEREFFGGILKELSLIKKEMWAALLDAKGDRVRVATVLMDIMEYQQKCLRSVGIKIANGSLKNHTGVVRIIHETVPSTQFDIFGKDIVSAT